MPQEVQVRLGTGPVLQNGYFQSHLFEKAQRGVTVLTSQAQQPSSPWICLETVSRLQLDPSGLSRLAEMPVKLLRPVNPTMSAIFTSILG